MAKPKLTIRLFITPILVLSACGYFIWACSSGLKTDYVEHNWKVAEGKILSPDLKLAGKENEARQYEGMEQAINYEYEVNGERHFSNSVAKDVFVLADDYPEGKVVDVYYDPTDVTKSVLVRTKVQKQYLYVAIATCIFVIALTMYYVIRDVKQILN